MNLDLDLLSRLVQTLGVSGLEDSVATLLRQELAPCTDAVKIDAVGNVVARIDGPAGASARVMVYCHIDQVGFRVKRIQRDGYLRLNRCGGGQPRAAQGGVVRVGLCHGPDVVHGVVGIPSDHLSTPQQDRAVPGVEELYVDLGLSSDAEVRELGVEVGSPVSYAGELLRLPGGDRVAGPAMDDRIGCAILVELARRFHADRQALGAQLQLVGVAREETTCKGLRFPARRLVPDLALGLDCTVCYDTPDVGRGVADVALGKGPVIPDYISTSGLNAWSANPRIRRKLLDLARQQGIPTQQDSLAHTIMLDAQVLPEEGIPSGIIYVPNRNTHSAVEVADLADIERARDLAVAFVQAVPFDTSRGW